MSRRSCRGLFVVGTGTDVGKTYVSALICRTLAEAGMAAAYYKAAASGNPRDGEGRLVPMDARFVRNAAGLSQPLETMCPYVFEAAVSPHLAARLERQAVEADVVRGGCRTLSEAYDYVAVEGSGGIVCPLRAGGGELWLEDVVRMFGIPSVIVADAGLGAINSVALTASYMERVGLPVRGVIFNRFHPGSVMEEDNVRMVERRTGLDVLACVREGGGELGMDAAALAALYGEMRA
ncbi:MAG: dethiobiotin synthase [Treponemataceae bacterium]|nr:dethiobiotin synthase [Treponemataceae bacterium]